jgi:hypothetical protein
MGRGEKRCMIANQLAKVPFFEGFKKLTFQTL